MNVKEIKTFTIDFLPNNGLPDIGDEVVIVLNEERIRAEVTAREWTEDGFQYTISVIKE